MRDPKRIDEVLKELEEFWKKHPDLRLFQLMDMLSSTIGKNDNSCFHLDPFYVEDYVVIEKLKDLNEKREV